jgi:hypothetical protein
MNSVELAQVMGGSGAELWKADVSKVAFLFEVY